MNELEGDAKVSRTHKYEKIDPATVFKLAWFAIASKPGVLLADHSEAESRSFKGEAVFTSRIDEKPIKTKVDVDEEQGSVVISGWGEDEAALSTNLDSIMDALKDTSGKYLSLADEEQQKLRRALIAKTCWDRIIYKILNKAPLSDIYFQLAHGREMMIKATKGDELNPITLTTSGWLSRIEPLPRGEIPPAGLATELAKKCIEWKKGTQEVIQNLL
ncbi:MAG: hypothetical protein RTU09_01360 [Candidatus Thorarchaeota archaeon]